MSDDKDKDKKLKKRKYKKVSIILTDVQYKNSPDTDVERFDAEIKTKFPDLVGWYWNVEQMELILDFGESENPAIDFTDVGTVREVS